MRRKDREIAGLDRIEAVIRRATVCFLALCDGGQPYVVPLSFGHARGRLYFHSAAQGRKIDLIRRNPRVGFSLEAGHTVVEAENPCNWSLRYESVIGEGWAVMVDDPEEKRFALECILVHYGGTAQVIDDGRLAGTSVIRVDIAQMTGKRSA